jgi:hypothetical protein
MTVTVVDVVLGSLVVGLAGWALVQTGSAKPASRGCGGGCGPRACDPGEHAPEDEPVVTLGAGAQQRAPER